MSIEELEMDVQKKKYKLIYMSVFGIVLILILSMGSFVMDVNLTKSDMPIAENNQTIKQEIK